MENKELSSANNFLSEFKLSDRSLMQMRKSNGPNIEPCGTPSRIGVQSESLPLRTTL